MNCPAHNFLRLLSGCVVVWLLGISASNAIPITPSDKNAEALHEAVAMSVSMLSSGLGATTAHLNYTGTFQDTAWSAGISGDYLGRAVNFNFGGVFDPSTNAGSYTATGTLGSDPWSSTGTYSFVDNAVGDATFVFDFQAAFLGLILDRHSLGIRNIKTTLPNGDISKTDFGVYRRTIFGIPVGRPFYVQESDWVYPGNRPQDAFVSFELPDEGIALHGTADFIAGTASGVVSVPEPSSLAMLALGMGLIRLARRRRAASSFARAGRARCAGQNP